MTDTDPDNPDPNATDTDTDETDADATDADATDADETGAGLPLEGGIPSSGGAEPDPEVTGGPFTQAPPGD